MAAQLQHYIQRETNTVGERSPWRWGFGQWASSISAAGPFLVHSLTVLGNMLCMKCIWVCELCARLFERLIWRPLFHSCNTGMPLVIERRHLADLRLCVCVLLFLCMYVCVYMRVSLSSERVLTGKKYRQIQTDQERQSERDTERKRDQERVRERARESKRER